MRTLLILLLISSKLFAFEANEENVKKNYKAEVQVQICENENQVLQLMQKLNAEKSSYQLGYIENTQLEHYSHDWLFRLRYFQDQVEVTVKKYNSVKELDNTKCEYDVHGDKRSFTCKINNKMTLSEYKTAQMSGDFYQLLNRKQIEMLQSQNEKFNSNDLLLGFLDVDSFEFNHEKETYSLEIVKFKNKLIGIEISLRTDSNKEELAQKMISRFLRDHSLNACTDQSSTGEEKLGSLL